MRQRIKVCMICSSYKYAESKRVHNHYANELNKLYDELESLKHVSLTPYIIVFGNKVELKNDNEVSKAIEAGYKVYNI